MSLQADWPQPQPAIGRLANFSSLRKHRPKEYSIYDAYFGNTLCGVVAVEFLNNLVTWKRKKLFFFILHQIIFSVTKKIRENAFCYLKSQDYRIR